MSLSEKLASLATEKIGKEANNDLLNLLSGNNTPKRPEKPLSSPSPSKITKKRKIEELKENFEEENIEKRGKTPNKKRKFENEEDEKKDKTERKKEKRKEKKDEKKREKELKIQLKKQKKKEKKKGKKLGKDNENLDETFSDQEFNEILKEIDEQLPGENSHKKKRNNKKIVKEESEDESEDESEEDDEKEEEEEINFSDEENNKEDEEEKEELNSDGEEKTEEEKKMSNKEYKAHRKEKEIRTIFIGNLSIDAQKKDLISHFKKYGKIESVRFRSIPIAVPGQNRKESFISQRFHENRETFNGYLVFVEKESADKAAQQENGKLFLGKHIRVDVADNKKRLANQLTVFVGNLPYDVEDEILWDHFEKCGKITAVRVVRDKEFNIGKGFGYVSFEKQNDVHNALKMNESECAGRKLRVTKAMRQKKKNPQISRSQVIKSGKGKGKGPVNPREAYLLRKSYQGKKAEEGKIPRLQLSSAQKKIKKPRHKK